MSQHSISDVEHETHGSNPCLLLISSLPVIEIEKDLFSISKKFISGVLQHQSEWPGRLQVVMEPVIEQGDNLDYVTISRNDLPFDIYVSSLTSPDLARVIGKASLVMLMLYHRQINVAYLCKKLKIPFIVTSEYSLKTRSQIIQSSPSSSLKRGAKHLLEIYREFRSQRVVKFASGVQCNGTPTFEKYRHLNARTMMFFDTRITEDMLADSTILEERFERRKRDGVLRLAFSGRLIRMKGADHLILVAKALKDLGRQFKLVVYGDGDLTPYLKQKTADLSLQEEIEFAGVVDFQSELVPHIRSSVDIFVCCHRQGDPSCTYLETMSCGVPIAGYDNEAFVGLSKVSGTGWVTPMDDPKALALRINRLTESEIETESKKSLDFAKIHTFTHEFSRRMKHARQIGLVV
jgi:glycosyltransferase involved in cell wall biosynthesis